MTRLRRMFRAQLYFVAAIGLMGCVEGSFDPFHEEQLDTSEEVQSGLMGDSIYETADHPGVVKITIAMDGHNTGYACTASHLTKDWLITAAHCFKDGNEELLDTSYISPTHSNSSQRGTLTVTRFSGPRTTTTTYQGRASLYKHPHYNPGAWTRKGRASHDFGLIRLYDGGASQSYATRVYADSRDIDEAFNSVTAVGTGRPQVTSNHVKRKSTKMLVDKDGGDYIKYHNNDDVMVCRGDSGGPAFARLPGASGTLHAAVSVLAITTFFNGSDCSSTSFAAFGSDIGSKMRWVTDMTSSHGLPITCPVYSTGGHLFRRCH